MIFDGTDVLLEFKALKAFALEVKQLCLTEVKLPGVLWWAGMDCCQSPQSRVFGLDKTLRKSCSGQHEWHCPGEAKTLKAIKMETPKHSFLQLQNKACQTKTPLLTLSLETRSNELSEKCDSYIGNWLTLCLMTKDPVKRLTRSDLLTNRSECEQLTLLRSISKNYVKELGYF